MVIYPKIEFFADPDRGTGVFDLLNITFPLTRIFSLTLVNESEYDDKQTPYFRTTHGPSLNQIVSEKSFLTYSWLFDSNNLPHYHLDSYDIAIGWNQILHKNILKYQVVPHWSFARERRYKGEVGISVLFYLDF